MFPMRWNNKIRFVVCVMSTFLTLSAFARKAADLDSYAQGRAALQSGDYGKARKCFEAALKDNGNLEEIQSGLLRTLCETGAYEEGVRRAEEFLLSRTGSPVLHLERGRLAEAVGDYSGAEKHLMKGQALAPRGSTTQREATRALAELLEKRGRKSDARPLWDQLIEEYRTGRVQGSRDLGIVAVAAWHRGYVKDAQDIFIDATDSKLGEVSIEALADFGYLFLEKYHPKEAISAFRDCLKINRNYPRALIGIALAKRYDSDFESEIYTRKALSVNSNLVPALNALAELAIESEMHDESLEEISAALAVNPAGLEALSLQAACRYFGGDMSGFEEIEKKVLAINPSYGRFYYTLAENFVSRRKYQEAVDFNRKAIALDPELWPAYASLGMNLTRIGNLDEGRKVMQQAFDGDPYNVWMFNSLDLMDQMEGFYRIRSEHFSFLMSKEDASVLSSYAPALAEEAFASLTQRYGFVPGGPLQVEVFPDHGGFAVRTLGLPGLSGALGVCFGNVLAIDSPRARKAGEFNWGSTLWHELTHMISLQMSHHNIPRWFSEGLSVYEEKRARPGWGDSLTVAFMKAYKEGRLLKASELNAGILRPKNPEQIALAYCQAGLACEWMEKEFGFDKIRQSLKLFAQNISAEEVFRRTLGLDAVAMDTSYARFVDAQINELASNLIFPEADKAQEGNAGSEIGRKELELLLQRNPKDFFANLKIGQLLREEGAISEAIAHLKAARRLFPPYVEPGNPYELLGKIYLESNREEDALAEYLSWIGRDGNSTEPLLEAAKIYRNRKDWAAAARMLQLSVFIDPYGQVVQRQLGESAMEAGAWPVAITAYRALIGLNPSDPAGAHFDLARALLASGNRREAKREVLRSLEIAPSFRKAQQLLLKISDGADK
jgi:tetratricopeptide (TPR) repeat protein